MIDQVSNSPADAHSGGKLHTKSVYLETFGCQMNELDSELVRGNLTALGYRFTASADHADVILYNTCSVREQAENKVWSRVGLMGLRKKEGANFILGVIGCMAEREGHDMIRRFPQVDLMCGPGELDKLPLLIDNACKTRAALADDQVLRDAHRDKPFAERINGRVALQGNNSRRSSTLQAANDNLELLDLSRAFDPDTLGSAENRRSAYVRITRGCNKFCTYCVVPYTRGAEVHRPPDSIVDECKKLADAGVIEVTLLGQTVNHYIYTHGAAVSMHGEELPQIGPGAAAFNAKKPPPKPRHGNATAFVGERTTTFAQLLQRIHDEVPAIQRLRFVTSFPRDFGDDILHVMAECPRICKYLHVPAQSGSNRILKLMNRGYTAEQYVEFIDRARAILSPACATAIGPEIAGDFIVGFPTETDDDFELTKALLRRVLYKNSFIFKYSPRPGTIAIDRFTDAQQVPEHIKRARNNELLALQSEVSAQVHAPYVGRTVNVFVERINHRERDASRAVAAPARAHRERTLLTISAKATPDLHDRDSQCSPTSPSPNHQLTGRTEGDLITAFSLPADHPTPADDLLGTIVPVHITAASALLLRGELAT